MPLVRRTRAILRSAELGFLGVFVRTRVQTPRRWGEPLRAGVFPLAGRAWRPLRTNCSMVGNETSRQKNREKAADSGVQRRAEPAGHAKGPPPAAPTANRF